MQLVWQSVSRTDERGSNPLHGAPLVKLESRWPRKPVIRPQLPGASTDLRSPASLPRPRSPLSFPSPPPNLLDLLLVAPRRGGHNPPPFGRLLLRVSVARPQ